MHKDKMVAMRFSQSDYAAIKSKAERMKMNFTEFMTACALGKRIVVIDGLDNVLREQKAIGRNLNQLTTLCNMGKIQCPDLTEVKKGFGAVFDYLYDLSVICR
jgi:hypothetical protein